MSSKSFLDDDYYKQKCLCGDYIPGFCDYQGEHKCVCGIEEIKLLCKATKHLCCTCKNPSLYPQQCSAKEHECRCGFEGEILRNYCSVCELSIENCPLEDRQQFAVLVTVLAKENQDILKFLPNCSLSDMAYITKILAAIHHQTPVKDFEF